MRLPRPVLNVSQTYIADSRGACAHLCLDTNGKGQAVTSVLISVYLGLFQRASSVQSLSCVRLFATPWTAHQASLSITNSWSLLKLMFIKSVMPSNHLILWRPLLLLPSVFHSIRVFSSESVLHMRWPKYWSFSISPSNEH